MSRWRISNKRMPRGQLADVKKFMRGPERLAARSVAIPIESDPQRAADVAGSLAGDQIRSFEMWWDAAESRLRFVIIADERDADDFERAFRVMYPNAAFDGMSETVPAWFDRRSAEYRVFDVGTRHGHYATIFDGPGARNLITSMAGAIQSAGHAWIQFVFMRFDCTAFLRAHMSRLDGRFAEINRGEYTSWGDEITGGKPRRHPELGYDLTSSYKGLKKHAMAKMQGAHLVMSIRGLVQGGDGDGRDADLQFDKVSALSVDGIDSAYEHLTKFRYGYDKFYSDTKKSRIRVPGPRGAPDHRICMFESRHLPDPGRYFGRAISQYFDKKWWGLRGYQTRRPMPFLILNPAEVPLFVHLPDPSTPNIDTTRGVRLPSKPSEKAGFGVFDLCRLSMRFRPDFVVVGEILGQEADGLFQAAASGSGCMCSFHASSAEHALTRLEAPPISLSKSQTSLLTYVLHMSWVLHDNKRQRKLISITEIAPGGQDGGTVEGASCAAGAGTTPIYVNSGGIVPRPSWLPSACVLLLCYLLKLCLVECILSLLVQRL